MEKSEFIKSAYGEHWETVKDEVDENGWIMHHFDTNEGTYYKAIGFTIEQIESTNWLNSYAWRPTELRGLETNNGWTRTCDMLPKNTGYYMFCIKGVYSEKSNLFAPLSEDFKNSLRNKFSHWKPYRQIKNPLY